MQEQAGEEGEREELISPGGPGSREEWPEDASRPFWRAPAMGWHLPIDLYLRLGGEKAHRWNNQALVGAWWLFRGIASTADRTNGVASTPSQVETRRAWRRRRRRRQVKKPHTSSILRRQYGTLCVPLSGRGGRRAVLGRSGLDCSDEVGKPALNPLRCRSLEVWELGPCNSHFLVVAASSQLGPPAGLSSAARPASR